MKASVVIPTYNKAYYLEYTLEALFHQSYDKAQYEVIVVNDGSSDNTEEITRQFAQRDWNFHVINQLNLGRGVTRNTGIQAARGNIVILTEDDCICTGNLVAEHVMHHADASNKVVAGLRREVFTRIPLNQNVSMNALRSILYTMGSSDGEGLRGPDRLYTKAMEKMFAVLPATLDIVTIADVVHDMKRINRLSVQIFSTPQDLQAIAESRHPCPWNFFLGAHISVNRESLLEAGLFDESFQGWGEEDIELGYRLFRANATFDATLNATVYHQLHPMSAVATADWVRNYVQFCEKYKTPELYLRWKVLFQRISQGEYEATVARIRAGQLSMEEECSIKEQYDQFVATGGKFHLEALKGA